MNTIFSTSLQQALKKNRMCQLTNSLSLLRKAETSDVVLVSGGEEFYAHKLILEASSEYFVKMFNSNMTEKKSGRVVFKTMEAKTLEAILDFIYTGEIEKVTTLEQVKKVLAAAHMIHLECLVQCCIGTLISYVSLQTFRKIWKSIELYGSEKTEDKILKFLSINCKSLMSSTELLHLNTAQIKKIIIFMKNAGFTLDPLLNGIMRWIGYDLEPREKLAKEIFNCFDARLVSQVAVLNSFQNENLVKSSEVIKEEITALLLAVAKSPPDINKSPINCCLDFPLTHLAKRKIVFFSERKLNDTLYHNSSTPYRCTQEFDFEEMTWLPVKKFLVTGIMDAAVCQFEKYIFFAGGSLGTSFVVYDTTTGSAEYACGSTTGRYNSGLCVFKNKLFHIGGKNGAGNLLAAVEWMQLPIVTGVPLRWKALLNLQQPRSDPTLTTSSTNIYVTGGSFNSSIEYFHVESQYPSTIIVTVPQIPSSISLYVVVLGDTIYGIYEEDNVTVQMKYKGRADNSWNIAVLTGTIPNIWNITSAGGNENCCFVSINRSGVPSYIWFPEDGSWHKLPQPKGKCMVETSLMVYTAGI